MVLPCKSTKSEDALKDLQIIYKLKQYELVSSMNCKKGTKEVLVNKNIEDYLSAYRMINDYIEIKSGRIINLSFEADLIVDKNYNKADVLRSAINTIKDYMDVNKHLMGEEIYVGDLQKEIGKIDGVINLISLKVFNETGSDYSKSTVSQEVIPAEGKETGRYEVDLEATDGILYNEGDTMMEIKKPETDIRIRIKER